VYSLLALMACLYLDRIYPNEFDIFLNDREDYPCQHPHAPDSPFVAEQQGGDGNSSRTSISHSNLAPENSFDLIGTAYYFRDPNNSSIFGAANWEVRCSIPFR
jgi:hypothetical protein